MPTYTHKKKKVYIFWYSHTVEFYTAQKNCVHAKIWIRTHKHHVKQRTSNNKV